MRLSRKTRQSSEFGIRSSESPLFIPHSPFPIPNFVGFTLVELIIVTALLLLVGGGLLTTFMTGQTSYLSADAYVQVQQEARRAFDNVVRELREAGNVAPAGLTNQLNFQIARGYNSEPPCQSPNPVGICWGSETQTGDWVHYAIRDQDGSVGTTNDRQLVRCVNASSTDATTCDGGLRVLANYVTNPTPIFNYTAAPTNVVVVTLQIQYQSPLLPAGSQSTPSLTSQVKLRN